MRRYQNNAFRILGLWPEADIKQIIQRVNEIKVKKSVGADISYAFDFPWMGEIDRSEHNVLSALQRLENPVLRLKEEIFWFWTITDTDSNALECLIQGKRQGAHELWKTKTLTEQVNKETISAFANQMVLSHSSVLGKEIGVKYNGLSEAMTESLFCNKCKKGFEGEYKFCILCGGKLIKRTTVFKKTISDLSDAHWNSWQFALNRILLVTSQEEFWDIVKDRAKKIDDPRLTEEKVDAMREAIICDIAEPNFTFISQSLISKDFDRTKKHASLLNGSSLSSEVLREGFNRTLSSHVTLINRHCQKITERLNVLEKRDEKNSDSIIAIYSELISNVEDTVKTGDIVDINFISDYGLAKDNLAKTIRRIAIDLNNLVVNNAVVSDSKKITAYNKAYEMIKKSIEFAGSTYLREKLRKDEELINDNLETDRINSGYYSKTTPQGPQSKSKTTSDSGWGQLIGWGIFFVFVIALSTSDDSSSNKISSQKTAAYSSQLNSSSPTYQLKERIESIRQSTDRMEQEISEMATSINLEASDLEELANEIESLETSLNSSSSPAQYKIDEYQEKLDDYNERVEDYNKKRDEFEELADDYQQKLDLGNNLVKEYNNKIR